MIDQGPRMQDPRDALSFVEAAHRPEGLGRDGRRSIRAGSHLADSADMPKHLDDLILPAREGRLNVMRAASRASVQRVIQTSSLSAIFHGRDDPN